MNELEKVIFNELEAAACFKEFFLKVSILQSHFNKKELKELSGVITGEHFINKFGGSVITYMNDNIHKERALPFNNISESVRIRRILAEYEIDMEV